ncbi:MAG: hypothetical protein K6G36_00690 [Candidatus Saccharibacteria bacterium]|nr:hypothetical protein [Candidatus Saccharibacteria bacterium]
MNSKEGVAPTPAPQAEAGAAQSGTKEELSWDSLKNIKFGGASIADNFDPAVEEAGETFEKANTFIEETEASAESAFDTLRESGRALDEAEQYQDDLSNESVLKTQKRDELSEAIDDKKKEIKEKKAENRFSKYIKNRTELAGQILKAGGSVVAGALKGFTAKVMAKMPAKIEIHVNVRSNEEMASRNWNDYQKDASNEFKADAPVRDKAHERIDKIKKAEDELTARKNNFQDALEKFHKAKTGRDEAKTEIKTAENKLKEKKQEYRDVKEDLAKIDFSLEYAKNEAALARELYDKAEKVLAEAETNVREARVIAKEKALNFDRLQTLAQFKAELGGKSVEQMRSEILSEKSAYEKFLKSVRTESLDVQTIESTRKEYEEKLNALDVYEQEIAKDGVDEDLVAAIRRSEPIPTTPPVRRYTPARKPQVTHTPEPDYQIKHPTPSPTWAPTSTPAPANPGWMGTAQVAAAAAGGGTYNYAAGWSAMNSDDEKDDDNEDEED